MRKRWRDGKTRATSYRILVATAASARGRTGEPGLVGFGVRARVMLLRARERPERYSVTLAYRDEQIPYTAELLAIEEALRRLALICAHREISVLSRSLASLQVLKDPKQQSGQTTIREIYARVKELKVLIYDS